MIIMSTKSTNSVTNTAAVTEKLGNILIGQGLEGNSSAAESESERIELQLGQEIVSSTSHFKNPSPELASRDSNHMTVKLSSPNRLLTPNLPKKFLTQSNSSLAPSSNISTSNDCNRDFTVNKSPSNSSGEQAGEVPVSSSSSTLANGHETVLDNVSRSSESSRSFDGLYPQRTPELATKPDLSSSKSSKSGEKKKKQSSWYNMLNPTYKSRSDDFKRLFKELPEAERLIVDYSCAMQKDILVHGRLYVSQNYICFYANIFRWETLLMIRCRDVASMTKEKTARVIPNAIQICTNNEKHFFTSFGARDKTYLMLFRIWQNALLEQPMSSQELWQWVHLSYGDELGLTSDDDDYVSPHPAPVIGSAEDEKSFQCSDDQSCYSNPLIGGQNTLIEKLDFSSAEQGVSIFNSHLDLTNGTAGNDKFSVLNIMGKNQEQHLHKNKGIDDYLHSDLSDTTESDLGIDGVEISCLCESHEGKEVLNIIVPIAIDQLFTLVFTKSNFMMELFESRKTYDVLETPWQPCEENRLKMRQLTYTLTLNHSMAKIAQTTDTQRLMKQSKPGQLYVVDCEIVNTGIPYSDTFSVKSRYCLSRVSNQETRIIVHGHVNYKKSVWGLVKSLIEKTAVQGLMDFCTDLEVALKQEAERSCQVPGKKTRRRKRTKTVDMKDGSKDGSKVTQNPTAIRKLAPTISGLEITTAGPTSDLVIRFILSILVALLLLNGLLFYKLWSLEDQSLQLAAIPVDFELPQETNPSPENLLRLLRQQELIHRTEAEKWKEAVGDVIKLIRLMENSLSDLKNNIESYGSSAIMKSVTLASTPKSAPNSASKITKP